MKMINTSLLTNPELLKVIGEVSASLPQRSFMFQVVDGLLTHHADRPRVVEGERGAFSITITKKLYVSGG